MSRSDPRFPVIDIEPRQTAPEQQPSAPPLPAAETAVPPIARAEPSQASESTADDDSEHSSSTITEQQMTVGGYGVSVLLHLSILVLMATIVLKTEEKPIPLDALTVWEGEKEPADAEVVEEIEVLDMNLNQVEDEKPKDEPLPDLTQQDTLVTADTPVDDLLKLDSPEPQIDEIAMTPGIGLSEGSMFAGRGEASRAVLVAAAGGNSESEAAVAMGLRWLAAHQNPDGSWSFDHVGAECDGTCGDPGHLSNCTMGATSMALLAFLGAGHTHQNAEYSSHVRTGIEYLLNHAQVSKKFADLRQSNRQGNMYVHGLATMALSEAYAMTGDRQLEKPTQFAVNFIVDAQHKEGGWRYEPKQPGDTSVVGWQILALESARTAGLKIPRTTFGKATNFLDSVQANGGASYGYMTPGNSATTTAVGLLCRMYFGWERDRAEIRDGAKYLAQMGPLPENIYYNYYATQVLHHYGGDEWQRWNEKMRDHLVDTQIRRGHGRGSWDPADPHGGSGGRLYMTTLATMTLEVYYRHLPLYQWRDSPE